MKITEYFPDILRIQSFTELSLVWEKAWSIEHPVRIEHIDNMLLALLAKYYTKSFTELI